METGKKTKCYVISCTLQKTIDVIVEHACKWKFTVCWLKAVRYANSVVSPIWHDIKDGIAIDQLI